MDRLQNYLFKAMPHSIMYHEIFPGDLTKRARVMIELINAPPSMICRNTNYIRKQARKLIILCNVRGCPERAEEIAEALFEKEMFE